MAHLDRERALLAKAGAEAADLCFKHGFMPRTVEAAYFHVTRAYRSLEEALMAKVPDHARQEERLVHLAAVCIRAAEAINALAQEKTDGN